MLSLRAARSLSSSPFFFPHISTSSPTHNLKPKPFNLSFSSSKPATTLRMTTTTTTPSATTTVEHIVLFKVKDGTDQAKITTMLSSLNALSSLDPVLHISAAPIHRLRSSPIPFTHILHSRHSSKDLFQAYASHPSHLAVVTDSVRPIIDDAMALDWVAPDLQGPVAPPLGSAVRVTFLKVKENLGDGVKGEILGVIKGIKDRFGGIDQISCGENFTPGRDKGYSIASVAVFQGLSEMEAVDAQEELVNLQKDLVRDHLDGVVVLDFVVPSPQSSSL
ncbi:hypothetical protein Tsubulata_947068 [Turnera subulata]|uniref:Stress-response A/B barrel domain-containing protein n=1 Tax=Turnera subulata TaxID=218843 RepID=A0A9Q0FK73_9ROSI|nr:hypothetical protein Tsubulata_947068 [Turnera subulata]